MVRKVLYGWQAKAAPLRPEDANLVPWTGVSDLPKLPPPCCERAGNDRE